MDKNKKNKKLALLNPIEMYYEDYFSSIPNEEERYSILTNYRDFQKNQSYGENNKDYSDIEKSFKLFLEFSEKIDYFSGVRNIVNQLLSDKDPTEIFEKMFPNSQAQAEVYKSQFTDACDIIIHRDEIDWKRMNIPWYDYHKENNFSFKNIDIKLNWNIDFWNQEARKLLFKFWRERYAKTVLFMSPAKLPSGGTGFFDSEFEAAKVTTYKFVYYDTHKVNQEYSKRTKMLKEEQKISQDADKYRLHLLLEAERTAWVMWRYKNIFLIKEGDNSDFIGIVRRKNEQNEIAFKMALSDLIEYDRAMGLPITDPDRDFKGAEPINVAEYKRWLTRKGRIIEENSDEYIFLKNLEKKDESSKVKPLKLNFIPIMIEDFVDEQSRMDRREGIVRNKSGIIVSEEEKNKSYNKSINISKTLDNNQNIENVKKALSKNYTNHFIEEEKNDTVNKDENLIHNDVNTDNEKINLAKKEIPKIKNEDASINFNILPENEEFKSKGDLNSKFSNVLEKIKNVSKEKNEIENQGFIVIDPNVKREIPKGNPYLSLFDNKEKEPESISDEQLSNFIKNNENKEMSEDNSITIEKEQDLEYLLYDKMIEFVEEDKDKDKDKGEGDKGSDDIEPIWIIEGKLLTSEARRDFSEKRKKLLEKRKRIKEKTIKVFDRNKQIEKMKSEWVSFPEIKDEGSFWDITKSKLESFKEGAATLWKDRIQFNLKGNEIKKISILKNISAKFKTDKNYINSNSEELSVHVYENDLKNTQKNRRNSFRP